MGKPKRKSTIVNYAQLNGPPSDDEDFMDFSPTTTRRNELSIKSSKSKEDKIVVNVPKEPLSRRKSPRKRVSNEIEEMYKDDLKKALERSISSDEILPLKSIQNCSVQIEDSNIQAKNSIIDAKNVDEEVEEVECVKSNIENIIPIIHKSPFRKKSISSFSSNECPSPLEGTSSGFTAKRRRKMVNFKEDSDEDSSDAEIFQCGGSPSDSEDSIFSPSPKKKKEKAAKPKKKNLQKSNNIPSNKSIKNLDLDKNMSLPTKLSLNSPIGMKRKNLNPLDALNSPERKAFPLHINKLFSSPQTDNHSDTSVESFKGFNSPKSPKIDEEPEKFKVEETNKVLSKKVPEIGSYNSSSLKKDNKSSKINGTSSSYISRPTFKSPLILQTTSSNHIKSSSANASPAIGLRLGLSRKGFKPLHPKVSINKV